MQQQLNAEKLECTFPVSVVVCSECLEKLIKPKKKKKKKKKKIKRKKEKKPSNLQTDKQKQLKFGLSLELRKLGPLIQVQSLISVPDN